MSLPASSRHVRRDRAIAGLRRFLTLRAMWLSPKQIIEQVLCRRGVKHGVVQHWIAGSCVARAASTR
jgi:hypothetical protein